ncbi:MAG: branched-chain amino acid ABC transporter permease [Acidimicrobiia bacterium]|nr:branched-chain amino acid ABC transporter permease [Acidimicrobiia bacterium]
MNATITPLIAQVTDLSVGEEIIQLTVQGLGLGAIYALIAIGFVIVYKATEVINFAHGALMLLGTYIVFSLMAGVVPKGAETPAGQQSANFPEWLQWWLDIPVAPRFALSTLVAAVIVGLFGVLVERSVLHKMVGQPVFAVVLITLGLELAVATAVQVIWSPQQKVLPSPLPPALKLQVGNISIQWANIWAVLAMGVCVLAFFAFFKYSRFGVAMRATAHDQEAAMAMGIKTTTIFAIAWAIAGVLAAIAGAFYVPARLAGFITLTPVRFAALSAFPAAILGGLDSPGGAVVGGLGIGVAQVLSARYLNPLFLGLEFPNFHLIFPYLLMIVVLLIRPYGLFGTPEVRRV